MNIASKDQIPDKCRGPNGDQFRYAPSSNAGGKMRKHGAANDSFWRGEVERSDKEI
jgi:hypothetical protein